MTNKGKMIEAIYAACLTKRATLVIFYLINRADQSLTCFPGVKTIATECNISPRTVQRALNDLEEAGFLDRESRFHDRGGQRSNLYKLKVVKKIKSQNIEEVTFDSITQKEEITNEIIDMEIIKPTIKQKISLGKRISNRMKLIFLELCHRVTDSDTPLEL